MKKNNKLSIALQKRLFNGIALNFGSDYMLDSLQNDDFEILGKLSKQEFINLIAGWSKANIDTIKIEAKGVYDRIREVCDDITSDRIYEEECKLEKQKQDLENRLEDERVAELQSMLAKFKKTLTPGQKKLLGKKVAHLSIIK